MFTRTLRKTGCVSRTVMSSNPPRVEYAQTKLGDEFLRSVRSLADVARSDRRCPLCIRLQTQWSCLTFASYGSFMPIVAKHVGACPPWLDNCCI